MFIAGSCFDVNVLSMSQAEVAPAVAGNYTSK